MIAEGIIAWRSLIKLLVMLGKAGHTSTGNLCFMFTQFGKTTTQLPLASGHIRAPQSVAYYTAL